jgi:N-acetylmuramoyl-L-alanine amidase CwlA
MFMSYPITVNLIKGLPQKPYRNGVGAYEGVVAHSTATPEATAAAEYKFESTHFSEAFVHYFVDWTSILQVADIKYLSYNSGPKGNARFVGVELCETKDPAKFKESYSRYTWLLAKILFDKKLGVKRKTTIWTHHDVSSMLGGSDHTDPDNYLASHGVSIDKLVADVTAQYNAMAKPVAPKPAPAPDKKPAPAPAKPAPAPVKKPAAPAPKPKFTIPSGTLKSGAKGTAVTQLQTALNAANFSCGTPDGSYGAKTVDAVKRFQSVYCNPADGVYGPKTAIALNKVVNK